MDILTRGLPDDAVYWAPGTVDDYGQVTFSAPVDIKCRWEDIQEEFVDSEGTTQVSKSRVFIDRAVAMDGYLWEGTIATSASTVTPTNNAGAERIRARKTVKSIDGTKVLRSVWL